MKISACPKCGSRRISVGTMGDGVLAGYTTREVCRDCGYQGMPVIFDTEQDYKNFIKKLKEGEKKKADSKNGRTSDKTVKDEKLELSKKDKKTLEFLNELKKEISQEEIETEEKIQKPKNWWFEIGLAFGISGILVILSIPQMISLFGMGFGIIYSLLIFIPEFLGVLLAIVIIEYFLRKTKDAIIR